VKVSALLQDIPPARHPLWRRLGWGLVAATLGFTLRFLANGSEGMPGRTVGGDALFGEGTKGTKGTVTEQLGPNRMVLAYKTISGSEQDLLLEQVTGRLDEQAGQWRLLSPKARREAGVWTLQGPMDLGVAQPGTTVPLGQGRIESEGPAIRWNGGEWEGLAPLRWESLEGSSRGTWNLPAGWRRETDGKLRVERGPVRWQAPAGGATPTLQAMDAERLWATPGFQSGHLEGVKARLSEGSLQASVADLSPDTVTWPGPLSFERADGWRGDAQSGRAPRPQPGASFQQVEFRSFRARRALAAGEEQLSTEGARWTPAGLRLEGSVVWDQPVDGQRLTLKAPRVFMREAAGRDLPESLPVGHAVAEGQALLTWGRRTLSSPRIQVERATRRWILQGPVLGRGEDGTFTGGAGHGDPRSWTIEGPVQVNLFTGGSLRGAKLVWEDALVDAHGPARGVDPAAGTALRPPHPPQGRAGELPGGPERGPRGGGRRPLPAGGAGPERGPAGHPQWRGRMPGAGVAVGCGYRGRDPGDGSHGEGGAGQGLGVPPGSAGGGAGRGAGVGA